MKRVGVLALQGAFAEHMEVLRRLGVEAVPVRVTHELDGLGGLIIPGGESTTIGKLMVEYGFPRALQRLIKSGLPILGTCSGMILLADRIRGYEQTLLRAMDMEVSRNAFGRQVDSFEVDLQVPVLGSPPFHAVFIRAPRIESVGKGVEVLATLPNGNAVAARQGNLIALAFHPELTDDTRFHQFFLSSVAERAQASSEETR